MTNSPVARHSKHARFWEEMRNFGIISSYLFICFVVLALYKSAILAGQNIQSLSIGIALGKALIIGKFILIGEAVKVGTRVSATTLLHRIAWKSLLFWLMLIVLTLIEEIVVGWFHDRTAMQVIGEYLSKPMIELLAPTLVMLLILVPLICATEISRALGPGVLKSLLLAGEKETAE